MMNLKTLMGASASGLGICLMLAMPSVAQDMTDNTFGLNTCLSLDETLELAADRDPQVMRALAREADFEARVTEARALRRPTLSAFGRSGFGDTSVVDNQVSNQVGLRLSQRIFDFGDSRFAREAAEANSEASRYDTQAERLDAARTAGGAFLTFLDAKEKFEQTSERRSHFVQQLESLDRLLEIGGATLTERATAASEVSDAETYAFELEFRMEQARITMELATGLERLPCQGSDDVNMLEARLLSSEMAVLGNNPELLALRGRADALSAETRRQKRSRLPVLSVVATGSYASIGGFDQFEYRDRIGLDVNVPLYSGNGIRAATQRASAREQQALSDIMIAERELRQTLQITQRRIDILQKQLEARQESSRQKAILIDAAEREQSAGTLTFREMVEIRLDYEQSIVAEITTRYDLAREVLELRLLQGTID
jgi:outer membrane protein